MHIFKEHLSFIIDSKLSKALRKLVLFSLILFDFLVLFVFRYGEGHVNCRNKEAAERRIHDHKQTFIYINEGKQIIQHCLEQWLCHVSWCGHATNIITRTWIWEVQLWIEWPTPGLCPGEVGRKSSMCSILLVLICGRPLGASPASVARRLVWRCLEHFLHIADLKCLPLTQENSWHNNKTRRTAQAPKNLVFAMEKRDGKFSN